MALLRITGNGPSKGAKMKYRRLTRKELELLEQDFIRFLASHQITADDWEKWNENEMEKVDRLIEIFSDIVFTKFLSNIKYLEEKLPHLFSIYYCGVDKILMLGLQVKGESTFSFNREVPAKALIDEYLNSGARVHLISSEKEVKGKREEAIFEMIERGCLISKNEELFQMLQKMKTKP